MKYLITLFLMLGTANAQQVFNLKPTDCGDHRIIICTAQIVEGGTFHIEIGKTKHLLQLIFAGADKFTATDYQLRASLIGDNGIDHLIITNLDVRDSDGVIHAGSGYLTLTARNVNGVKNYTLTQGVINVQ